MRHAPDSFAEATSGPAGRFNSVRSDDLYLGANVALAAQTGILPELAIFLQVKVPPGSPACSADKVLPGMNFVYAWRVGERTEIDCNTNVNRRLNPAAPGYYTEYLQIFNVEYDVGTRVMVMGDAPAATVACGGRSGRHNFFDTGPLKAQTNRSSSCTGLCFC